MDTIPQYRIHRSGKSYRTDVPHKRRRRKGLISLPYTVWREQIQHLHHDHDIRRLWRLCNREEILKILDELNPNHKVNPRGLKVPMLEECFKLEWPLSRAAINERMLQYSLKELNALAGNPRNKHLRAS